MIGPLMLGYKDSHAEDPDTQRKVNTMKHKKVFFFREKKNAGPNLMVKVLKRMHLDMKHRSCADMSAECNRLGGSKKNIDSRISIAIQKCIACTHRGPNFTTGKIQKKESLFYKDFFIQRRKVTNHRYYTLLFSLECLNSLNTGFTTARFVNMENRSVSETVNKVATDHWIYGKPQNVFFIWMTSAI